VLPAIAQVVGSLLESHVLEHFTWADTRGTVRHAARLGGIKDVLAKSFPRSPEKAPCPGVGCFTRRRAMYRSKPEEITMVIAFARIPN